MPRLHIIILYMTSIDLQLLDMGQANSEFHKQ